MINKEVKNQDGISSEFLWYIFKPYAYVFGVIVFINFILVAFLPDSVVMEWIPGEYRLACVGFFNLALCYTGAAVIKSERDEKYAFALLQGNVENKIEKGSFKDKYFSMAIKGVYVFMLIICFNMFLNYAVKAHPAFRSMPSNVLWSFIYGADILIGHLGMLYIQKQKEIKDKEETVKENFKNDRQLKIKEKKEEKRRYRSSLHFEEQQHKKIPPSFCKAACEEQVKRYEENIKQQENDEKVRQQKIEKQRKIDLALQHQQQLEQSKLSKNDICTGIIRNKLKMNQRSAEEELLDLKSYNMRVAQEKANAIENRILNALSDFSIEDFAPNELPFYNHEKLKTLSGALSFFKIFEMQLYGSYPVYLASLRLGVDLDRIRPPRDLDLRFEVNTEDLTKIVKLIKHLFVIGFSLKDYHFSFTDSLKLKDFISEKKSTRGYLNLFCLPNSENKDAYEIEITVIFKKEYRKNYNPFNLLRHCLKIKYDQVSFDGINVRLKNQLADDILEEQFNIDVDALVFPEKYNVFNFFPRLLRNRNAWGNFYNMDAGNVNVTLINLPLIITFFKVRFALKKQKECFLELVNLIVQEDFFLPETELIIKGFVCALLESINIESRKHIGKIIFHPHEQEHDVNVITEKLKNAFSTVIPIEQGNSGYNKQVLMKFYLRLMGILIQYKPDHEVQTFFSHAQQMQESILFNTYAQCRARYFAR